MQYESVKEFTEKCYRKSAMDAFVSFEHKCKHFPPPSVYLGGHLEVDELSMRARSCLFRLSEVIGRPVIAKDLMTLTDEHLMRIKHCGKATIKEIREWAASQSQWEVMCDW